MGTLIGCMCENCLKYSCHEFGSGIGDARLMCPCTCINCHNIFSIDLNATDQNNNICPACQSKEIELISKSNSKDKALYKIISSCKHDGLLIEIDNSPRICPTCNGNTLLLRNSGFFD